MPLDNNCSLIHIIELYMKLHHDDHHQNAKTVASLAILCVAFVLLLMFNYHSENIIEGNNFKLFMTLAIVGAGLLVSLLYLINKPHTSSVKRISTPKAKAKSKKKKK